MHVTTRLRCDMSANGNDYATAKALKLKGFTYRQIADKTGINYAALRQYGARNGWNEDCDKIAKVVSQHVADTLTERATGHVLKISGFADKAIDSLITKDLDKLKLGELATLASIADTFDKIARRTYGLDAENASKPRVTVNVAVLGERASNQDAHVMDVDALVVDSTPVDTTAGT